MDTKEITKRLNVIERRVLSKQELINEIAPVLGYAPSTLNLVFKYLIKNLLVIKIDRNKYQLYDIPIYYKKVESFYKDLKDYFSNVSRNTRSNQKEKELLEIFNKIAYLQGYKIEVIFKKI